ncbi:DNA mismatch repair protein HSM3 N-terminal domain-containing protein [Madurella fahalii]|uniref:DNA mismatch repair protein HSM3 N-terminal domain-containing protein n=1 Tax=Madurella fahalii TaxID=1157608 RepID=A0ABQ0GLA9_9PEZI
MDTAPITGLDELDKHLDDLVQDPTLPLIPKLFDDVELQLTESNIPPLIPRFLPRLTIILKQYGQDPAILASLTIKLLRPVSFTQVLQLASEESLIQALESPAPAANLLAMTIIHKAAASPADAAILSLMTSLVGAFIRRWLAAPQVEVGQKGGKVLGDLLDIDCELPPPPPPPPPRDAPQIDLVLRKAPGHGKLWHLLFNEAPMYTTLLDLCSGRHPDTAGDAHQLSLAQGRVLRLLPRLAALNFAAVSRSAIPAPTAPHLTNGNGSGNDGVPHPHAHPHPRPGEGLLQFAALRMVQRADLLMHLSLVDFFETFVGLMRVTGRSPGKVETMRAVLGEATAGDEVLREALLSLPDRTVEEEAEPLREWLREVMPGEAVRLAMR